MILGGMPAVLDEYLLSGDLNSCSRIQTAILQTLRDDVGKYASRARHRYLQKVLYAVPKMAAPEFKYSHEDLLARRYGPGSKLSADVSGARTAGS